MNKKYIVGIKLPFPIEGQELFEFKTKEASDEFIEEIEKKYQGVEIMTAVDDGVEKKC